MRFTLSLHPFSVNERSFAFPLKVPGRRTGKKERYPVLFFKETA